VNEKGIYTSADCDNEGFTEDIAGKVIAVNSTALPDGHPSQLFCCVGIVGKNTQTTGKSVLAVSLSIGEHHRFGSTDIIGTLKPGLLPDEAKLYLSQIRPGGACGAGNPEYRGYCFLEDGRYSAGVPLNCPEEAVEFAEMQAHYQHRVMICDSDDFSVMEMKKGSLVHISQSVWEAYRQGVVEQGQTGGMMMT